MVPVSTNSYDDFVYYFFAKLILPPIGFVNASTTWDERLCSCHVASIEFCVYYTTHYRGYRVVLCPAGIALIV